MLTPPGMPPDPYRPGYYRSPDDDLLPGLIVDPATGRPPVAHRAVPWRPVARVVLVVAAVVVLAAAVTADDRPGIEIPPGPPTVWVTTTVQVPPPPAPAPLVEVAHPTGAPA